MPARNLTADEAAEMDARKNVRSAKALWDAAEKVVDDATKAALVARRDYEAARNKLIRQVGPI